MPSNAPEVVSLKKELVLLYCDVPEFHEGQQSHRPDPCNFSFGKLPVNILSSLPQREKKEEKKISSWKKNVSGCQGFSHFQSGRE